MMIYFEMKIIKEGKTEVLLDEYGKYNSRYLYKKNV